jgi:hypothetical protein
MLNALLLLLLLCCDRLHIDLHSRNGTKLGALQSLDTSANGNLVSTTEVWSWCLGFNGNYTSTAGVQETLQVGQLYRLVAYAVGPVAVRDAINKIQPRRERVSKLAVGTLILYADCVDSILEFTAPWLFLGFESGD